MTDTQPSPQSTAAAPAAPTRPARWPRLLLIASLTLNVLGIGLVAGAWLRDGHDHRRAPPVERNLLRDGGFMPFFDAMPRAARARMAEAFRAGGARHKPDRAALAADFEDFVSALRAEPFDPAALDRVLAAQHARAEARVSAGRRLLLAQITDMSQADRNAFADALEARFQDDLGRIDTRRRDRDGHGPRDQDRRD